MFWLRWFSYRFGQHRVYFSWGVIEQNKRVLSALDGECVLVKPKRVTFKASESVQNHPGDVKSCCSQSIDLISVRIKFWRRRYHTPNKTFIKTVSNVLFQEYTCRLSRQFGVIGNEFINLLLVLCTVGFTVAFLLLVGTKCNVLFVCIALWSPSNIVAPFTYSCIDQIRYVRRYQDITWL